MLIELDVLVELDVLIELVEVYWTAPVAVTVTTSVT